MIFPTPVIPSPYQVRDKLQQESRIEFLDARFREHDKRGRPLLTLFPDQKPFHKPRVHLLFWRCLPIPLLKKVQTEVLKGEKVLSP